MVVARDQRSADNQQYGHNGQFHTVLPSEYFCTIPQSWVQPNITSVTVTTITPLKQFDAEIREA